ncbi:hypothetical protein JKF63_07149 [Porcisia hertigi]|uniref:Uncharacterized protein n=1 Tax=Porcisia hertigi TaxID=2761500 RepID=A0A836LKF7_9TRYP|nr:hypothetical protein JKF63_07149 [Porcisia hertigi]
MNRNGTCGVSLTRRAAAVFLWQVLPSLMTMPPVPKTDTLTGATASPVTATAAPLTTTSGADTTTITSRDAESTANHSSSDLGRTGHGTAEVTHPSFPPRPPPRAFHTKTSEASSASNGAFLQHHEWGKGAVPWTEMLAEAVLLLCNKIDIEVRHLWAARAALLYLVSEEEKNRVDPLQQRSITSHATSSGLTRTLSSALNDKAQLALALMRTLENSRRQSRLMREVLQPVSLRFARSSREKRSGVTSSDGLRRGGGGGGGGVAATGCTRPRSRDAHAADVMSGNAKKTTDTSTAQHAAAASVPQQGSSFVFLERYLADGLLPLLYAEFAHFCRAVEQWHDCNSSVAPQTGVEATAASVNTRSAAPAASRLPRDGQGQSEAGGRRGLSNISRSDMETFSLLAAVLHRTLSLHSVVRSGDDVHFDFRENRTGACVTVTPESLTSISGLGSCAETPTELPQGGQELSHQVQTPGAVVGTPPSRPRCQPAVPLRAFRLAIEAVATQLDAIGGPHTGAQELALSQSSSRHLEQTFTVAGGSPPPFVPPHSAPAVVGAPRTSNGSGSGCGGQPPHSLSPSSVSRFGGTASSARSSHVPPEAPGRICGDDPGHHQGSMMAGGGSPHRGTRSKSTSSSTLRFGNFNIDGFLPVLNLCLHDRSFHLFLTTSAYEAGGPQDATALATGSPIPPCSTTLARPSSLMEGDVVALAAAVLKLLLLGVYWAPLCRTYQLPTVLALFTRVATAELTHTATEKSASRAPAMAGPHASLSAPTTALPSAEASSEVVPPAPLDTEVLRRLRGMLLPPSDDLATPSSPFVQQLRRLVYSSGRYLERTSFGSFASITTSLDRVLSQWPMHQSTAVHIASVQPFGGCANAGSGCANNKGEGGSGGVDTTSTTTAATAYHGSGSLLPSATSLPSNDVVMPTETKSAADAAGAVVSPAQGSGGIFRAPVAAGLSTLLLFAAVADEFWARMRGRMIWQSISRRGRAHSLPPSNMGAVDARHGKFIGYGTRTCTYTQLQVTVPNLNSGVDAEAAAAVRATLLVPSYVLRQMGLRVVAAERTSTPDELLRVFQTSERVESYMAVPNSAGCATAARPLISEYLRGDFMWGAVPNNAFVPLITALVDLEVTSITVPELLMLKGSLEGGTGLKRAQATSSRLQGRFTECLLPKTIVGLKARISPHELRLLTLDGEDARALFEENNARALQGMGDTDGFGCDDTLPLLHLTLRRVGKDGCVMDSPPLSTGATLGVACLRTGGAGSTASLPAPQPASCQGVGETASKKHFGGQPMCYNLESVTDMLWEPAYSGSSDESARIPRKALAPLLRSVTLLAEAERRVDGAVSPDRSTCPPGSESVSLRNIDLILRIAYRLLFDPIDGAAAVTAPGAGVPLEALVTLYISLTSVSRYRPASSNLSAFGAHAASRKPPEMLSPVIRGAREAQPRSKSPVPAFVQLGVNCCLAHCEVALRARLMAIAHDSVDSSAGDSTKAEPDHVANDLRVLLQLAVLAEELLPCPADMVLLAAAGTSVSTNELVHRQLFRELGASLREAPLQRIAGEVSRLLWWVTRRADAEARGEEVSQSLPLTSWVETLLLQEIGVKRPPVTNPGPTSAWRSSTGRTTFQLYEWALLPLYTKLEALSQDAAATTPTRPQSSSVPLLDDFTSLEDDYSEYAAGLSPSAWLLQPPSHGPTAGVPSRATTGHASTGSDGSTTTFSGSFSSVARHTATLEAALHALPTQCDSFHVFLHVVRQLFLSHPVVLSTAPDAALYYELRSPRAVAADQRSTASTDSSTSTWSHMGVAAMGRRAWATLPAQRAEVSHGLRQRYVDALFRLFKRLVFHQSCTAEELVELLHLLWLADPHASSATTSASSSTTASTSQWPSLFGRCSSFVKESLAELDDAAAAAAAASVQDGHQNSMDDHNAIPSSSLRSSVPDVLQTVYRAVHYGLTKSIAFKSRELHWCSVNAAALHPRSVVLFLQCLNTVRGLEEQHQRLVSTPQPPSAPLLQEQRLRGERRHHSLSRSHSSALELFKPFVIYASITGEAMCGVEKMRYMPLVLEALSEMDPQLVLVVIQAVFSGAVGCAEAGKGPRGGGGGGGGSSGGGRGGGGGSARERGGASSMVYYHKVLAGSRAGLGSLRILENGHFQSTRTSFNGSAQDRQRLVESVAATMTALLMVTSHTQASSTVWGDSSGGGTGGIENAGPAMDTGATPQRAPPVHLGRAHHHALIFLRNSLLELLSVARSCRPLQCASEYTVVQILQLAVVQESPRLVRLLQWLFLALLLPSVRRVDRAAIRPLAWSRPSHSGMEAAAAPPGTLSASSTSAADSPARSGDGDKATYMAGGIVISQDTIGRVRVPATREALLLLRLLPVQCWRSLLQRDVAWPRYRGYALHGLSRRPQSVPAAAAAPARGSRRAEVAMRDPVIEKWNGVRGSLVSTLFSLDMESVMCLAEEAMGPMALLVVTTELLRAASRRRACSGGSPARSCRDVVDVRGGVCATRETASHTEDRQRAMAHRVNVGVAEPCRVGDDSPYPAVCTSFEALRRYASRGSVLTEEAVQPWLKAACDVLDQLSSTRHTDFLTVLEREAAWQRRVTEASTYRGAAREEVPLGVSHQTAVETVRAARAAEGSTRDGATEAAAPTFVLGEDGVPDVSDIDGSSGEGDHAMLGARTGAAAAAARGAASAVGGSVRGSAGRAAATATTSTSFFAATTNTREDAPDKWSPDLDTAAARPFVLDWRPIVEFMRVVRQVDPAISARQVRLEWWMRQPELATDAPLSARLLPAAHTHPLSPATSIDLPASLAEAAMLNHIDDARDVLHNAVGAILQHVREYWQAADRVQGARPLLMMNMRDALNLYASDTHENRNRGGGGVLEWQPAAFSNNGGVTEETGEVVSPSAKFDTRDTVDVLESSRWLEGGVGSSVNVDGSHNPWTFSSASIATSTAVLGLVRPCPTLSLPSMRAVSATGRATTAGESKRRRLALLRRAGMLASAQEVEQRCRAYGLSGATPREAAAVRQDTCAAAFWRRKARRLQLEMLECIFGDQDATTTALVRSQASNCDVASNGAAGIGGGEAGAAATPVTSPSPMGECMSGVERCARHRLQLLSCDDLAQQLLLLITLTTSATQSLPPHTKAETGEGGPHVLPAIRQLQMRIVLETMAELLPSASTRELIQVVLALLKLSIPSTSIGVRSTDAATPQLLHYVRLEARRLLANVAVLVANDVERFEPSELFWIITRLHTPVIRAAPAVVVAPPPHTPSSQEEAGDEAVTLAEAIPMSMHRRVSGDALLDVSMSYMSAAVARAIRVAIEGTYGHMKGEHGDVVDACDNDGDVTGAPHTDRTAGFDNRIAVDAQSASPVTLAQWTSAVAAAEQHPGKSQIALLLRLVERSAV